MATAHDTSPILLWFRRDLRLADHPMLSAAVESGRPVIPVFVLDPETEALGAAPKWRLGVGLDAFARALDGIGSRLILRRGPALTTLRALAEETGSGAIWWSRLYDPVSKARDTAVKAALKEGGYAAQSFAGHLLHEPWTVATKTGGFFKVYTPMWKAVKDREVEAAMPAVGRLPTPSAWPESEALTSWGLGRAMNRGGAVVARYAAVGEAAAQARLDAFCDGAIVDYAAMRDIPSVDGTSGLSAHLSLGEIGPRTCWWAGVAALEAGRDAAETFLKELVWREFAYHLVHHTPHITEENWRPEWSAFPWNADPDGAEITAWRRGRTGIPFVDAAMRQMYVTGTMHNRGRMIVASYLTKHLMTHWKLGLDWFADCLVDWDPASNAMGWQWSAGSGPDATPYFRVFNPVSQREKFDPKRAYVDAWIAEGRMRPSKTSLAYFEAIPRSWGMAADDPYPDPIVTPEAGRARALEAYAARGF